MTTYLVTAASGHYGRLAVTALLDRGVAPERIRAGARDTGRLADLAALGVSTIRADYDDPDSLDAAMAVPEGDPLHVLLVSGNEVGRRIAQHGAVSRAAARAGVGQLVYTSAPRATTTELVLAPEHKATEELLAASGVPTSILRHNWYVENYTPLVEQAVQNGALLGSAGSGRLAPATRADLAAAAAVVLTEEGHLGRVYELGGDERLTYADVAAAMAEVTGAPIAYTDVTGEEHHAALTGAGLDEGTAGFVVRLDQDIRRGDLDVDDHTLSRLLGRPTTPFVNGLRADLDTLAHSARR